MKKDAQTATGKLPDSRKIHGFAFDVIIEDLQKYSKHLILMASQNKKVREEQEAASMLPSVNIDDDEGLTTDEALAKISIK